MKRCDLIAEAMVMGDPLSEEDRVHLEGCQACQRLTSLPGLLAASTRSAPPRPGFSARMMAAARERIGQRRRRRFATFTFALAAAGASAVAVDRRFLRDGGTPARTGGVVDPTKPPQPVETLDTATRQELESLLSFDRALAPAADWDAIEASAHPYRGVLRSGGPK
jgi:hypothetical protein